MVRFFALAMIWLQAMTVSLNAEDTIERSDLLAVFNAANVTGTFVLMDAERDQMTLVNADRAVERFFPASTFKFANSLIALETKAVKSENEVIPYGGAPQIFKSWERDMALGAAFKASNVPIYQELARRIGVENYTTWLIQVPYGNGQVGQDAERFWLDGPLAISAVEQAQFMAKLALGELDLSQKTQMIVQEISKIEQRRAGSLHGKTGWTIAPDPDIGWFVGWVEKQGHVYAFALNMDMKGRSDAPLRVALVRKFLKELGVYE